MQTTANIARHPFTRGLDEGCLQLLERCAVGVRFDAREEIFREGSEADAFYLLCAGHVTLQVHWPGRSPVVIQTLTGGETLGASWLVPPYRWQFTAAATEPTEVVRLPARALREAMLAQPEAGIALAMRLAGVMIDRLQSTRLRLLGIYDTHG